MTHAMEPPSAPASADGPIGRRVRLVGALVGTVLGVVCTAGGPVLADAVVRTFDHVVVDTPLFSSTD